jgi:hypothetical protein
MGVSCNISYSNCVEEKKKAKFEFYFRSFLYEIRDDERYKANKILEIKEFHCSNSVVRTHNCQSKHSTLWY